jgi:hypothetical protein
MNAHLSNEIVERFHNQSLTVGDRGVIYNHILGCETCRRRVVTAQTEAVAVQALSNHLLPQEGDELYHLDPATIEAFVDDKLDALDRNIAKLHLEDCAECSDEVTDLRESLATMRVVSRAAEVSPQSTPAQKYARFSIPMRIAAAIAVVSFAAIALLVIWRLKSTPAEPPSRDIEVQNQPTPVPSPSVTTPGVAPSPNLGANPNGSNEGPSQPPKETVASLKDGANEIALDKSGNVTGVESLPAESRVVVKSALEGAQLNRPDVLDEVATAPASVRGPSESEEPIKIVYPASAVIAETRPKLRWAASKTATAYRIEIADEGFHQVAKSQDLPTNTLTWTTTSSLRRGMVYTWTIRAVNRNGELSSVTSQGKFKVLPEDRNNKLNRLRRASQSHLALGLFYAHEGMTAQAEREFGILLKDNPDSDIAKRLLSEVRSWRKR